MWPLLEDIGCTIGPTSGHDLQIIKVKSHRARKDIEQQAAAGN